MHIYNNNIISFTLFCCISLDICFMWQVHVCFFFYHNHIYVLSFCGNTIYVACRYLCFVRHFHARFCGKAIYVFCVASIYVFCVTCSCMFLWQGHLPVCVLCGISMHVFVANPNMCFKWHVHICVLFGLSKKYLVASPCLYV